MTATSMGISVEGKGDGTLFVDQIGLVPVSSRGGRVLALYKMNEYPHSNIL